MTDVKGYTSQTEENIALVNEAKEIEERYLRWVNEAKEIEERYLRWFDRVNAAIGANAQLVTGKYRIQEGFMWSVRGIFKPQRIRLPEDGE